jgi:hypothetical protein
LYEHIFYYILSFLAFGYIVYKILLLLVFGSVVYDILLLLVFGDIVFYICKEKFRHEVSKHGEKKVIPSELIKKVKFSKIDDLLELVQEKNPFYPGSMFDEIFIYEKQYDGSFLKYKVSWEYYIE